MAMSVSQSLGDGDQDFSHFAPGQLVFASVLGEVPAADVVGVEARPVIDHVEAVDVDNMRMIEGRDCLGLVAQRVAQHGAFSRGRGQLERDLAI